MGIVVVFRGPCGGGKTEIAKELKRRLPNFEHIDVDKIKEALSGTTNSNDPFKIAWWFLAANKEAKEVLARGKSVILDEAFSAPYLFRIATDELTNKVLVVEVCYSLEEHRRRYRSKERQIHVTDEEIERNYGDYIKGLPRGIDHDFEIQNHMSFDDPSLPVGDIVDKIAKEIELLQNGSKPPTAS